MTAIYIERVINGSYSEPNALLLGPYGPSNGIYELPTGSKLIYPRMQDWQELINKPDNDYSLLSICMLGSCRYLCPTTKNGCLTNKNDFWDSDQVQINIEGVKKPVERTYMVRNVTDTGSFYSQLSHMPIGWSLRLFNYRSRFSKWLNETYSSGNYSEFNGAFQVFPQELS